MASVPVHVSRVIVSYAPVICIPGFPRAGDSGGTSGLKWRDLVPGICRSFNFQPIHGREHLFKLDNSCILTFNYFYGPHLIYK